MKKMNTFGVTAHYSSGSAQNPSLLGGGAHLTSQDLIRLRWACAFPRPYLMALLLVIGAVTSFPKMAEAADSPVDQQKAKAISWDQKQAKLKSFKAEVGDFAFKMLEKPGGAKTVGIFIAEKIGSDFAAFGPDDKFYVRAVGVREVQRTLNHIAQTFLTTRSANEQRTVDEFFAFLKVEEADPAFKKARKVLAFEELFDAIEAGRVRDAKAALAAGADVNGRHELDGLAPLHYAAGTGKKELVEVLCEAGANLNQTVTAKGAIKPRKTLEGWTALHLAAVNGWVESVQLLIEKGADKDAKDEQGVTPLGRVIEKKDLEMAAILKAAGAKEAVGIPKGQPPNSPPPNKSKSSGPAPNNAQQTMAFGKLMGAIQEGQIRGVKDALAAGADVNGKSEVGLSPLILAAMTGKTSIVEALCDAGASLNQTVTGKAANTDGFTALHFAALNGHEEVAQLLLTKGAERNAKAANGLTPLALATALKQQEVVAVLKADGAKPQGGNVVPQQANRPMPNKTKEADQALLKPTRRPSVFEELFEASERGVVGSAKAALVAGADVNGRHSLNGFTPLMIAVDREHPEITALLLGHGAKLEATNKLGNTALHIAAYKTKTSIAKLLLDKGALVNAQNAELRTPLAVAANNGNKPAVLLLLEHGADTTIEDKWGTALASDFRLREINPEIASLIEKAGTNRTTKPSVPRTASGNPGEAASKRQPAGAGKINASVAPITSEPSAAEQAMDRFIELLLQNDPGANKTPDLNLALLNCARQGLANSLRKCLERGAEIETTDAIGNTALMLAAQRGHLPVVKCLMEKGADVSKVNRQGKSALGLTKNTEIIAALKEVPAKR